MSSAEYLGSLTTAERGQGIIAQMIFPYSSSFFFPPKLNICKMDQAGAGGGGGYSAEYNAPLLSMVLLPQNRLHELYACIFF